MGIVGRKMSAADYRAARRAGTVGASAVGVSHTVKTAEPCHGPILMGCAANMMDAVVPAWHTQSTCVPSLGSRATLITAIC